MNTRWSERIVAAVIGLFVLAATVLKIESPALAVGAVAHTFAPVMSLGSLASTAITFVLIVVEGVLGIMLLLEPTRVVRILASLLLFVFAVVLVTRFSGLGAPPCGCLGRMMQSGGTVHVWLDAVRNIAFAAALLLTLVWQPTERSHAARQRWQAARPTPTIRAFALIETLVVILVIAVLLAIALPVLRSVRIASKVTRSLSAQQQLVAAISAYGQTYSDFFPHFEALDGTAGPVRMHGMTVMTGYFRAHMGFWLAAVGPDDMNLINLAAWPPRSQSPPMTDREIEHGLHYSVYYLTATIAADPSAFSEPLASNPNLDPALLRGVRWSEMTFPSQKGLFLDFALLADEHNLRYVAGFGDGSAAELPNGTPPQPIVALPAEGPRSIVISTRNGIRGTDR